MDLKVLQFIDLCKVELVHELSHDVFIQRMQFQIHKLFILLTIFEVYLIEFVLLLVCCNQFHLFIHLHLLNFLLFDLGSIKLFHSQEIAFKRLSFQLRPPDQDIDLILYLHQVLIIFIECFEVRGLLVVHLYNKFPHLGILFVKSVFHRFIKVVCSLQHVLAVRVVALLLLL